MAPAFSLEKQHPVFRLRKKLVQAFYPSPGAAIPTPFLELLPPFFKIPFTGALGEGWACPALSAIRFSFAICSSDELLNFVLSYLVTSFDSNLPVYFLIFL